VFLTSALDGGDWSASRPRWPFDKRLGGPRSRSGRGDEEKTIPALTENRNLARDHHYTD